MAGCRPQPQGFTSELLTAARARQHGTLRDDLEALRRTSSRAVPAPPSREPLDARSPAVDGPGACTRSRGLLVEWLEMLHQYPPEAARDLIGCKAGQGVGEGVEVCSGGLELREVSADLLPAWG